MKTKIEILKNLDLGWVEVWACDDVCAKCQKLVNGRAISHPRTHRFLHVDCALAVSGLRNIKDAVNPSRP